MSMSCRSPAELANLPALFCKGADSSVLNDAACDDFINATRLAFEEEGEKGEKEGSEMGDIEIAISRKLSHIGSPERT